MKVAVVGHSGFVGTALVRALESRGYELAPMERNTLHAGAGAIQEKFGDCSWMVNCAGVTSCDKIHGWQANTQLPEKLYRDIVGTDIKGFLHVSSVAALKSTCENNEIIDDRYLESPDNTYGLSKFEGDHALRKAAQTGTKVCILRPPILYGRDAKGVFGLLKKCSTIGLPLPLKGLDSLRNFMFVDNFAEAVAKAIEADLNGTYITVDHTPVSPAKLYDKMCALSKKGGTFGLGRLAKPLMKFSLGARSNSLLKSAIYSDSAFRVETGYLPPFSFDEAMSRTMVR